MTCSNIKNIYYLHQNLNTLSKRKQILVTKYEPKTMHQSNKNCLCKNLTSLE